MWKLIILLVAALMALSFGPSFTQVTLGEDQVRGKVVVAATPEAYPENLTGEVVSVDKGSRRMTVKQPRWLGYASKEVTFAVAEPAAPMLAWLQPGDRVRVGYVEAHGHFIARAITKIPAEREIGQ